MDFSKCIRAILEHRTSIELENSIIDHIINEHQTITSNYISTELSIFYLEGLIDFV